MNISLNTIYNGEQINGNISDFNKILMEMNVAEEEQSLFCWGCIVDVPYFNNFLFGNGQYLGAKNSKVDEIYGHSGCLVMAKTCSYDILKLLLDNRRISPKNIWKLLMYCKGVDKWGLPSDFNGAVQVRNKMKNLKHKLIYNFDT